MAFLLLIVFQPERNPIGARLGQRINAGGRSVRDPD